MPGSLNFNMFGVSLQQNGVPNQQLAWSKVCIESPLWAFKQPYFVAEDKTYFLNSLDSALSSFQIMTLSETDACMSDLGSIIIK